MSLVDRFQRTLDSLGIDASDVSDEMLVKAHETHMKGLVRRIITLSDPNARSVKKAEIIAQCEMNSDPTVVAARTKAQVSSVIAQAKALSDMSETERTTYTLATKVVKGVKGKTKSDKSDKSGKGKSNGKGKAATTQTPTA